MLVSENPLVMGQIPPQFAVNSGHAPVINTYGRDDVASAGSDLALVPKQRATRRMAGNVSNDTIVYASVPDLAVAVSRAGGLVFEYWLNYSTSDVTEGIGVQLAFSGTASDVVYSIEAYTALATRANLVVGTAFGSGMPAFTAGPGASTVCTIVIRGSCTVVTAGDLNLQLRAETGNPQYAALLTSSWGQVWAA